MSLHGYLIINKEAGMGSTTVVSAVKRILRPLLPKHHKVGHGGTLDPLATGVLPIALGEATKTISYILDGDKEYEFTVTWGTQTTTDDSAGTAMYTSDVRPTPDAVNAALPSFTGLILQTPPAFSALKVDGERAYDLARKGEAVELAPREVCIHRLTYIDSPTPDTARFSVHCSKGTYVRALARDLALKLGTYGHISALNRTRSGPFALNSAISLEKLQESVHNSAAHQVLLSLMTALADIPALAVSKIEAQRLRHGQELMNIMARNYPSGTVLLVTAESQPVALVAANDMALTPVRVFNI
ncbi:MAG: tRNA pseudouridine(55) synthase TruB [Bdellovibrionales bacterium]